MSAEIERFARDLENSEELSHELADFGGSIEELADWLHDKGYRIETGDLAAIMSAHVGGLSDDALDKVSGGGGISEEMSLRLQISMDRRSKALQTLSNILKRIGNTQDSIIQNLK